MTALARIGKQLVARRPGAPETANLAIRTIPAASRAAFSAGAAPGVTPESIAAFRGARLLFFGGKGGVGKTTIAAAAAVRLARADPSRRVLLLSTDPAHSLADVFGVPIGDRVTTIRGTPKNMHVRELDAAAALEARRADLDAAFSEIVSALGGQTSGLASAERTVGQLMDLAPPGIDEQFGVLTVVEARQEYPLIVADTAPTGHTLCLLELPDAAREWVQVLLRVLLKYRSLVRPWQLASELVDLSKMIRALQDLMRDHDATRFIVVTRAAEVPRLETERLLHRLRRLNLATPAIVVNALTLAPWRCSRCSATAKAERRQLARLEGQCRCRECVIIQPRWRRLLRVASRPSIDGRASGHRRNSDAESCGWNVRLLPGGRGAAAVPDSGRPAASARSGAAFLERKKAQRDASIELVERAREVVEDLYDRLTAESRLARRRSASEVPVQGGPLLLDAAFLVPKTRSARFAKLAGRAKRDLGRQGYRVTISGPWPPDSFIQD